MERSKAPRLRLVARLATLAGVVVLAIGVTGVPSAAAPKDANPGNRQGGGNQNPDNDDNGGPGGNAGNNSGNNGCGVGNGGGNGSNGVGGGTNQRCGGHGGGTGTDPATGGDTVPDTVGDTDPDTVGDADPGSGDGTGPETSEGSGGTGSPGSGVVPGPGGSNVASGTEVLGDTVVPVAGSPARGAAAQAPEELAFTGPVAGLPMAFSGVGMIVGGAALTHRTRRRTGGFPTQRDGRPAVGRLGAEPHLASPVLRWHTAIPSIPSDGLGQARTGEA